MSWFDLTGICFGFGISLLASACTLGTGLAGVSRFRVCQLSGNLAILQFALLVAGWLLGVGRRITGSVGGLGRYGLRVPRGNKDVLDGQTESCP